MFSELSPRERDIVVKLREARSVKEIAFELGITSNTVKSYLKTIYQKTTVHSSRELLLKLYEERAGGRASVELLGSLTDLLEAPRSPIEGCLEEAIRRCVPVRSVQVYRFSAKNQWLWLVRDGVPDLRWSRVGGERLGLLVRLGFEIVKETAPLACGEGDALVVLFRRPAYPGAVLVEARPGRSFDPYEVSVVRILVRLAESQGTRTEESQALSAACG